MIDRTTLKSSKSRSVGDINKRLWGFLSDISEAFCTERPAYGPNGPCHLHVPLAVTVALEDVTA